jgi:hypothetical protein
MDAAQPILQKPLREGNCAKNRSKVGVMKHPSSREFFAYWNGKRGDARAPDRSDIEPGAVRALLGDIFVLSCDASAGHPFRLAGTRLCALFGRDLKDRSFSALFKGESRGEIEEILTAVAEDMRPAVAGLTSTTPRAARVHLELLLLPLNMRAYAPISMTGLLAPFEADAGGLGKLELTSYRYVHQGEKIISRTLRKLAIARGLMVYEGLR